jgi:zinc protease
VERAVREEADRLRRDGVSADELNNAKTGYLQALKVRRSSDTGLAMTLSSLLHRGRTVAYEAELEKKFEALTPDQVSEAFRKYFDPQKVVIVTAGDFAAPKGGGGR